VPDLCGSCCWKIGFRESGCRIQRIEICDNCCGTHRLVQMRARIMNQLQALAMNEGYRWKEKLFSEQGRAQLEKLSLAPWASRRQQELLELLDRMNPTIEELTAAVEREARKRPVVQRLVTYPGVGPLTALAFVLIIGTWERFPRGKQVGNYVGMIPSEGKAQTFVGVPEAGYLVHEHNGATRPLKVSDIPVDALVRR
jgi:transposase